MVSFNILVIYSVSKSKFMKQYILFFVNTFVVFFRCIISVPLYVFCAVLLYLANFISGEKVTCKIYG